MREQPEAVGPSEERARRGVAKKTLAGKQPTEGLTNKQMKESKNSTVKYRANDIVTKEQIKLF